MEKKSKPINKFIYCFSLLTWIINICFIIIPFFFEVSGIWVLGVFASVLIQAITSRAFGDTVIPDVKIKHKFLDICLNISLLVSIITSVICGVSLFAAGGGPETTDGLFYIVNHGEIVREITSYKLFLFFVICESLLFSCGILIFSSLMALRIRKLYLIQTYE